MKINDLSWPDPKGPQGRYYDPEMGRYLRTDPLGIDGGMNLYVFALNNPLLYSDAEGLMARVGDFGIDASRYDEFNFGVPESEFSDFGLTNESYSFEFPDYTPTLPSGIFGNGNAGGQSFPSFIDGFDRPVADGSTMTLGSFDGVAGQFNPANTQRVLGIDPGDFGNGTSRGNLPSIGQLYNAFAGAEFSSFGVGGVMPLLEFQTDLYIAGENLSGTTDLSMTTGVVGGGFKFNYQLDANTVDSFGDTSFSIGIPHFDKYLGIEYQPSKQQMSLNVGVSFSLTPVDVSYPVATKKW